MRRPEPGGPVSRHLEIALAELDRRRRHGFGLVWDFESPDNAERLHVNVKDSGDRDTCGLVLSNGVIVDMIDDDQSLYGLVDTDNSTGTTLYRLQPWEPRNGDLALAELSVPRSEISHVVHVPYDATTAVYPVLKHVETIKADACPDSAPVHALIEGENFHALQALLATHREKVDLIYIDPPYNTGSQDFAYNDRYVDETDAYRHSRWLRFMERRLRIARELLKDTGIAIVAIGDNEHHHLRMLLDQVMGPANFLADVAWQGRVKNDRRFTGGGTDFMLLYGRDRDALTRAGVRWTEPKPGAAELLGVARRAYAAAAGRGRARAQAGEEATTLLRTWVREHKGEYTGGVLSYRTVDADG